MAQPTPIQCVSQASDPLYDVAIIGLGPVGATLANLLAQQGLSVLALDREAAIYRLPRAIHFDGECMRVFQGVGISDALESHVFVAPGMLFVDGKGQLLIDWSRPTTLGPQGWHASYRFHQPYLETLLREQLATYPSAEVRLRHDVFAIDPQEDHVRLRLEDTRRGKLLSTRARYVVGCDGARSTVRRFMGTELEDLQSHERWLVVDVILHHDKPELGDHSLQICDPSRPATYVRGTGMRRRWELMLHPDEDATEMCQPERVWALLSRWVTPDEAVLERPATYTFHSVVAKGWRHGRLLLAGDAAHQTPPFMGQGMCAGIRDASNLAWKLGAVLRGEYGDALLDSYERERSPHVREFIETAVRLGGIIQNTDMQQAEARSRQTAGSPQVFKTPLPRLGPGIYLEGNACGRVAEQPTLGNGERIDDRVGHTFAVLARPDLAEAAQQALSQASTTMLPLMRHVRIVAADSPESRDYLDRLGTPMAVIRPDRYLAALVHDVDTLCEALGALSDALSSDRQPAPHAQPA